MKISEYSKSRAEALMHLDFAKSSSPFSLKWFEIINSADRLISIYLGTHSHTFYEIHYVFSGSISYKINNKIYTISAGEALLIPPSTPHKYLPNSKQFFKSSIGFTLDDDSNLFFDNCQFFKINNSITENTNYILKKADDISAFSTVSINGRIAEILEYSLKELNITLKYNNTSRNSRINTAISFIEKNVNRLIKSQDVADECCISLKQLNRIFLKEMNVSIHSYIVSSKILFAQKLIKNSDHSFKEIAYLLGFNGESNFTIFFKKHTGCTPSEYRKIN